MKNRTFIKSFLGLAVAGSSLGLTGASLAKAAGFPGWIRWTKAS